RLDTSWDGDGVAVLSLPNYTASGMSAVVLSDGSFVVVGTATNGSSVVSDVREALIGLGYSETEIRDALRSVSGDLDAASMLRESLRVLGVRRA
ncbi:MAG: hypothetical protein ACO292_09925, partial [Ilumatobacteraceae bacterium]